MGKKVINIGDYLKKDRTTEEYLDLFLNSGEIFSVDGSINKKFEVLTTMSKALSFKIARRSVVLLKKYTHSTVLSANIMYIKVSMMDNSSLLNFILDEIVSELGDEYSEIIQIQNELFNETGISDLCYNLLGIITKSSEELEEPLDADLVIEFMISILEEFYKSCEFKTLSRDQLDSFFNEYPEEFLNEISEYLSDYSDIDSAIEDTLKDDEIYDSYKLGDVSSMITQYNQLVGDSKVKLYGYFRKNKDDKYQKIEKNNHYLKLKNYRVILLYKDLDTGRIITTKRISNEEDMESIKIVIDTTSKIDIPFSISNYLNNEDEGGDY